MRNFISLAESLFLEDTDYPAIATPDGLHRMMQDIHFDQDINHRITKFNKYHLTELPIAGLHTPWTINPGRAKDYAARMQQGETPPPIVYDADSNVMIDGGHRLEAAKMAGIKTLPAYVGKAVDIDPDWDDEEDLNESGSKLYWKKGDPIKLIGYHITNSRIRRFSLIKSPGGIYFSPTGGKAHIKAEIALNSPLITNDRRLVQHSDQERRERLSNEGYDGMIWMDEAGRPLEIVAFDPDQIIILANPTKAEKSKWLNESGMSEVAHILTDIRNLDSVTASVDLESERVTIRFTLYNQPGQIDLRPLPQTKFRSKIYAAALAMNDGKQPKWEMVPHLVNGRLKPRAIKILTNPSVWAIAGLKYGNERF